MAVLGTDSLLAIRDYINNSNLIKVTYDELVDLRDNSKLIPGTYYQIIDYRTVTKQENTASALHNFDVIVLATSISTLSEDAYATYHINEDGSGDDYFCHREVIPEHQVVVGGEWISPMPSIEDVHVLYTLQSSDELYHGTGSTHDSAKIITELTTHENIDGVVVPAMLNPAPDGDETSDLYYVYDGTFDITERINDYVQFEYSIYDSSEEVQYDDTNKNISDLLICDIGHKKVVATAEFRAGVTTESITEQYKIIVNSHTYTVDNPSSDDKEINYLTTKVNERGIEVPCLVNLDPAGEGHDDYLMYVGTFTFNDTIYDMWQECKSNGTQGIPNGYGVYMLTNSIVNATFDELPCLYATSIEYIDEPDYEQPYVYDGTFTLDGVTYDRWNKYEYASGVYGIKTGYSYLTQRITSDGDFVISREDFLTHVREETTTYDKWQEYYPNPESPIYGFQDYWHLTNHLVNAITETIPEKIIFEKIINLDAWKLKYSLDNDENKFAWAIDVPVMQVYNEHSDASWLYMREPGKDSGGQFAWVYVNVAYNTSIDECSKWYDRSNDLIFTPSESISIGDIYELAGVPEEVTVVDYEKSVGKGVIYRLIDDKNNDLPYDFKNILFTKSGSYSNVYTFSYTDNGIKDASIKQDKKCYSNIIKEYLGPDKQKLNFNIFYSPNNTFDCYLNTFNRDCYDNLFWNCFTNNKFGSDCYRNTFWQNCYGNNFGDSCYNNTFGQNCNRNNFGDSCYDNIFEDRCSNNNLKNSCHSNTFGHDCYRNTFGVQCYNNIIGNGCHGNVFSTDCYNNTFDIYCNNNTLEQNCRNNIISSYSSSNIFMNNFSYNTLGSCVSSFFGSGVVQNIFMSDDIRGLIVDNYCQYIKLLSEDGTYGSLKNIHIHSGVQGTSDDDRKVITVARNLDYTTDIYPIGSTEMFI